MQFKGVLVIPVVFAAVSALTTNCSSNKNDGGTDAANDGVVGPDVKPKQDSGGGDSSTCTGVVTCEQCDASGYSAPQEGKPTTVVGACTQAELQAFVTACFSTNANTTTCKAWQTQDSGACGTCLNPVLQTSATWGPFDCATSSSPCGANSGGCVDLVLGSTATEKGQGGAGSCGDAITSAFGCEDYSCNTCTTTDFTSCVQDAVAHQCSSYSSVQTSTTGPCAAANSDAAPAGIANCFPQDDAGNVLFVNVFCGTGP